MKRIFLLLGSTLLLTGTAQAQAGLRVGGSLSRFNNSTGNYIYHNSSGSLLGYQVGLYYQVSLGKHLSLVPEVQFSRERMTLTRYTSDITDGGLNADYRERFSYLNVPVLLRLALGPVYVEAGPQASYLLGGRETGTVVAGGFAGTTVYTVDREVINRYRRWDVGPSIGVGVQLPAGVGLNVRAYQGLASLPHDSEANTGHLYRKSLQVSLTYQLPGH
ncbi:porin family protein [Hymenobacter ginkgonis]|nr:porin family protein [Hymenobacter ginkgonis]